MSEYAVVCEWAGRNGSAEIPDPPGCVACGESVEETEPPLRAAVVCLGERLRDGTPPPKPSARTGLLALAV